jgi:hypothetical protein
MSEMSPKLPLFFESYEIRKSKHSHSYVNLFMMSEIRERTKLGVAEQA